MEDIEDNIRDELLELALPLIKESIALARKGRIRDKELARVRISFGNLAVNLINSVNRMLKDKEIDELMQEVENLKNELKQSQERY